MNSTRVPAIETAKSTKHSATSRQIRGSSLMLVGRSISMVVNFAIQVLIIHNLSKAHYGAFAYALSFVLVGQTLVAFGLDRAITRFVPIYQERRDYNKMFGTILLVISTIVSLGAIVILLVYALQGLIAETLLSSESDKAQVIALLLILIGLAPVQALDDLIAALFAIFASPRSIFFRKYVLAPCLKLTVVLLLIVTHSNEYFLASGYLAAGILGLAIYAVMLWRTLRRQQLFEQFNLKTIRLPAGELFTFTIPLLTSDLVNVLMNSSNALLLGYFRNPNEVAAFQAVQPWAVLNQFVLYSFTLLFTAGAARLFARNDRVGINSLYWQTAIWISVLSFPIFAMTFSLAHPLTILVYGQRYEDSAAILALLAFGYYFNAALGFNGLTLQIYGKLRYVVAISLLAATANIAINLWLIPIYGAFGAACGTCATMVIHNILKQAGLRFGTGISMFEWKHFKVYLSIACGAAGLLMAQSFLQANYSLTTPYVYVSFALAAIVSLVVVGLNRKDLNIGQIFPELLRFPLLRRVLGR